MNPTRKVKKPKPVVKKPKPVVKKPKPVVKKPKPISMKKGGVLPQLEDTRDYTRDHTRIPSKKILELKKRDAEEIRLKELKKLDAEEIRLKNERETLQAIAEEKASLDFMSIVQKLKKIEMEINNLNDILKEREPIIFERLEKLKEMKEIEIRKKNGLERAVWHHFRRT